MQTTWRGKCVSKEFEKYREAYRGDREIGMVYEKKKDGRIK